MSIRAGENYIYTPGIFNASVYGLYNVLKTVSNVYYE